MSVQTGFVRFVDDDGCYLGLLAQNPDRFVVNSELSGDVG